MCLIPSSLALEKAMGTLNVFEMAINKTIISSQPESRSLLAGQPPKACMASDMRTELVKMAGL